ncbi:MAG: 4Fe-4S binding protein [Desulfarculus sp.]|nr:4Fe-4S binding protein [Desulfarculus sp.]
MLNRREVLKLAAVSAVALTVPACGLSYQERPRVPFSARVVKNGLVLSYSQTGNTRRIGRLIAAVWRRLGVEVQEAELRDFHPGQALGFDLIAVGGPVNHYDAPQYLKDWLGRLPPLAQTPVAAYVTHGLPPSNQHNTACAILEILAQRGGAPVGLETFGNLGTYPPAWAFFPEKSLAARVFPNHETYEKVRAFAMRLLAAARDGKALAFSREMGMGDVKKSLAPIRFSKLITNTHEIDTARCRGCGTCARLCPTGAIDPLRGTVDKRRCVDCMGCINNCPAEAVRMVYWGKPLTGYFQFLRENQIKIQEPPELLEG